MIINKSKFITVHAYSVVEFYVVIYSFTTVYGNEISVDLNHDMFVVII